MSSTTANERLARLTALGTAVWLDQIRRSLVTTGELGRLVREDCLRGVTSNPAIFEKAILGSEDYDEQIEELARAGESTREVYRAIAFQDVQEACDVLRPVHEELGGADGFVSLEVDPDLADDTERTLAQAREYHAAVNRPNLMIKIPGTDAGLPAIEEALAAGININVTLLFSVTQYRRVCERFIAAMERRRADGLSLDVHSVASFFVSRVDTEVDHRLAALGREDLRGRAGLANARNAYRTFREVFEGEAFTALRDAGCPVQRPLWASTGVKDPAYPDTLYVDGLAGPDTVNTMPMATLVAAAERSQVTEPTVLDDPTEDLAALEEAGIDLDDVTDKLLRDGIAAFVTPMEELRAGIESKREAIVTGRPPTIQSSLPDDLEPEIAACVQRAVEEDVSRRIWHRDETLWAPAGTPEIADRLGWLTIADHVLEELDELEALRDAVRADGLTRIVVLGMGGSSLAPEVFRQSFGAGDLHVLDSTDAAAVAAVPVDGSLFVVSSKSGGTIETTSALDRFWSLTNQDGSRFVAITDPGTALESLGRERGFRRVLRNDPEIGGRYSAMSYFGIAPAVLAGIDARPLLHGAQVAAEACAQHDSSQSNSGLWMGVTLGTLAQAGRDKLTFVVEEPIASLGLWIEQLIAESTGKHGRGALPVVDEPLGAAAAYGPDRVVVHVRVDGQHDDSVDALRAAGTPVLTVQSEGAEDLGRLMYFACFSTAVSGWVLRVNPFDQPDVQSAKDRTQEVLSGGAPDVVEADAGALRALIDAGPPGYLAVQGFVAPSAAFDEVVTELRGAIRGRSLMATTFGYGPRYLHSTGQFHKGGPPAGRFLQLVHEVEEDLEIPGRPYTFEQLKRAQADGDLLALRERGLPVERVVLRGDPVAALRAVMEEVV